MNEKELINYLNNIDFENSDIVYDEIEKLFKKNQELRKQLEDLLNENRKLRKNLENCMTFEEYEYTLHKKVQLKDNWHKLKQKMIDSFNESQDVQFLDVLQDMQELEQGSDSNE